MNYDADEFWLALAQAIYNVALTIWVWVTTRHRVTGERIDQLEKHVTGQVGQQDIRLTRVEEQVAALPTHTDIGGVFKRIDEVHGDVREIAGRLHGIERAVGLMNQHLLESGK